MEQELDNTKHFHSGDAKCDTVSLLDCTVTIMEIWDVKDSPYNQHLKRCLGLPYTLRYAPRNIS